MDEGDIIMAFTSFDNDPDDPENIALAKAIEESPINLIYRTNEETLTNLIEVYRTIVANTKDKLIRNGVKLCPYCKGFGVLDYRKDTVGNIYYTGNEESCHCCKGKGWS